MAEAVLTTMDSFGNMLAAKVNQSGKDSNQYIFFNKEAAVIFAGRIFMRRNPQLK